MRLLTTMRCGLLGGLGVAAALFGMSACGGGKEACTTIGCQSTTPALQTTPSGTGGSAGATSSGPMSGVPSDGLVSQDPSAGQLTDGDVCRKVNFKSTASEVNVLILLDRSVSMLEPVDPNVPGAPSRWTAITNALTSFVNSAQAADARVGLQFFGLMNGNDDCQSAKYAVPAVAEAPLASNRAALLAAISNTLPGSFTPTEPALTGALQYSLSVAQKPENANIPNVLVLASDGIPSECGPVGPDGVAIISFKEIIDTLKSYSAPPVDAAGQPTQPPIRTYLIGTEDLASNAQSLAQAGGGEAFLVGGAGVDLEQKFLDALLKIVVKPLDCVIPVPQTAPDTGEAIDFDLVRVRFTGSNGGVATEYPRTTDLPSCGTSTAWYYDNPDAPKSIEFCPKACSALGAGELQVELGCAPQQIVH